MAYLKPVEKPMCQRGGCTKRATFYVFNTYNANNGAYCTRHANQYRDELAARGA